MKFDEMNPAPPVTRTRFGTRGSVIDGALRMGRAADDLDAKSAQTRAPAADRLAVGRRPGLPYVTVKPAASGPSIQLALDRIQRPPLDLPRVTAICEPHDPRRSVAVLRRHAWNPVLGVDLEMRIAGDADGLAVHG